MILYMASLFNMLHIWQNMLHDYVIHETMNKSDTLSKKHSKTAMLDCLITQYVH